MAKRAISFAALAASLALPATAGHAEERAAALSGSSEFTASFGAVADLPAPGVAPGAVDITALPAPTAPALPAAGTTLGRGVASYYADKFNGRRTASGETFSNAGMTAAHRSLPFGTRLRLTNESTGVSVVVRVNDRGPFHAGRTLDVSRAAAQKLGLVARGSGTVSIERLD